MIQFYSKFINYNPFNDLYHLIQPMFWPESLRLLSLPLRFWVNILRNPHFMFDVHVTEVVDASLHVISQTFMDACTKTEHKLSRVSSRHEASFTLNLTL